VVEVELNDSIGGIDWNALSQVMPVGPGRAGVAPRALAGSRVTDLSRLLTALSLQGKVSTIADPRILALNNEPAIIRTDGPQPMVSAPGISSGTMDSSA
jgi:type II secretory pathway component GspD/PulD (secretin)